MNQKNHNYHRLIPSKTASASLYTHNQGYTCMYQYVDTPRPRERDHHLIVTSTPRQHQPPLDRTNFPVFPSHAAPAPIVSRDDKYLGVQPGNHRRHESRRSRRVGRAHNGHKRAEREILKSQIGNWGCDLTRGVMTMNIRDAHQSLDWGSN